MYTMGSYNYANKVLDFLDPSQEFFAPPGKVMCRPEGGAVFKKSIEHLKLDVDQWRRVVVVDDREDAWDETAREHLLQLSAFYYFKLPQAIPAGNKEGVGLVGGERRVCELEGTRGVVLRGKEWKRKGGAVYMGGRRGRGARRGRV